MSQSNSQLHLIQNQLDLTSFKSQLLRLTSDGDSLLFLNDSVFVLLQAAFNSEKYYQLTRKLEVFAIDEHLQARNITSSTDNVKVINFAGFVEKSQNCNKIVSW